MNQKTSHIEELSFEVVIAVPRAPILGAATQCYHKEKSEFICEVVPSSPHHFFITADSFVSRLSYYLSRGSGVAMVVIALLATVIVITSKLFMWSVPSANDWIGYLFVAVVYFSCPYAKQHGKIIVVDILSPKYPCLVQQVLSMLGDLLGCAIFILVAVFSAKNVFLVNVKNHAMSSTGSGAFLIWPFSAIIVVFSFLLSFTFLFGFIRTIYTIIFPEFEQLRIPPEDAVSRRSRHLADKKGATP